MAANAQFDFEETARQVFDSFLILKPDAPVEGLFRVENEFVIVSPAVDRVEPDGRSLKDWYYTTLHPLAMPIHIAGEQPKGAQPVAPRSPRDILLARGTVRSAHGLYRDLALALPREVPFVDVHTVDNERFVAICVSRALTPNEQRVVTESFENLGVCLPMRIEVVEPREPARDCSRFSGLELRTARSFPQSTPQALRSAVEADEDVWRRSVRHASTAEAAKSLQDAKAWPDLVGRSCLVGSTFPPTNIRSYLSLFPIVVLVAPLEETLTSTLASLAISRTDLLELARRGHVRFLAPQSLERYDQAWLAELVETAPNSVLLSRRLAAAALHDQSSRNPLVSLPSTAYERRSVLRALSRASEHRPPSSRVVIVALAEALSKYWESAEYTLQTRGAMASLTGSLAYFGTAIAEALLDKDVDLEIMAAAQNVEWAAALGSHIVPEYAEGYSSEGAAGLLVALSSGVPRRSGPIVASPREFELAEELLAFDNDTDVIDFVTTLGSGDLARFRELVPSIARGSRPEADLRELVSAWNSQVREYERKPDRIKAYGLAGIAMAGASAAASNDAIRSVIPLVAPLVPFLTTKLTEDLTRDSELVGRLLDWANGALAGTAPEAVLLSRLRKRVGGMKAPR
jgi:hypothetical protein